MSSAAGTARWHESRAWRPSKSRPRDGCVPRTGHINSPPPRPLCRKPLAPCGQGSGADGGPSPGVSRSAPRWLQGYGLPCAVPNCCREVEVGQGVPEPILLCGCLSVWYHGSGLCGRTESTMWENWTPIDRRRFSGGTTAVVAAEACCETGRDSTERPAPETAGRATSAR